jgi:hypothetical protein
MSVRSPLTGESSTLHLAQSLDSTQEGHNAETHKDRQQLEEVPLDVVEEKGSLNSDDGADKESVRNGGGLNSLGQVVEVGAQFVPLRTC